MITTSRYASLLSRNFAKHIAFLLDKRYIARGKKTIDTLVSLSRKIGEDRIIVVKETEGVPTYFEFITLDETRKWSWLQERVEINDSDGKGNN